MKISVVNSQKKVKLNMKLLKQAALSSLSFLKENAGMLSVYIVGDTEIKNLNYKYRSIDKPTDVLAFSMREGMELKGEEGILGDVVISAETALRQARRYKKSVNDEMNLYLVHGILHLVGYDDSSSRDRKKMFQVQEQILKNKARTRLL